MQLRATRHTHACMCVIAGMIVAAGTSSGVWPIAYTLASSAQAQAQAKTLAGLLGGATCRLADAYVQVRSARARLWVERRCGATNPGGFCGCGTLPERL